MSKKLKEIKEWAARQKEVVADIQRFGFSEVIGGNEDYQDWLEEELSIIFNMVEELWKWFNTTKEVLKMKLTFTGTFNVDDMRLINDFIETQLTTDAETESATIELDRVVLIDVVVNNFGDVEKIHFTKIEK